MFTPFLHDEERLAVMQRLARDLVRESCIWRTELGLLVELSNIAPGFEADLRLWREARKIFAITVGGVSLYPDYAFDPKEGFRPYPALATIIEILSEKKDDWGIAYWFVSPNGWINGARPQDMLASDPDRVIAAARIDATGIAHG
jgi:hypothetical protein